MLGELPGDGTLVPRERSSAFVAGRTYTLSGGVEDATAETVTLQFLDASGEPISSLTKSQSIRSRSVRIPAPNGKSTTGRSFSFSLRFTPEHIGQVKTLSLTVVKPEESRTAVISIEVLPERGPLEPLATEPPAPSIRPLGDVNGDAKLTIEDVVKGLRRIVGLEPWTEEISLDLGRTWPSGTTGDDEQTLGDAILLLRRVLRE